MASNEQEAKQETPAPPPEPIKQETALKIRPGDDATEMGFGSGAAFALLQRAGAMMAGSTLVPKEYQGNVANCVIALNIAARIGADPLMTMQNLYIVYNRPAWSAQFLIATINQSGAFSKLRYEWKGEKGQDEWGCRAWAKELATGDRLEGSWVTWKIAVDERWVNKDGSKWKTMPEQMFMYRAASWFVKAYAPELAMGIQTKEEAIDMGEIEPGVYEMVPTNEQPEGPKVDKLKESLKKRADSIKKPEPPVELDLAAAIKPEPEKPVETEPEGKPPSGGAPEAPKPDSSLEDMYLVAAEKKGKKAAEMKLQAAVGTSKLDKITGDKVAVAIAALKEFMAE